MIESSRDHTCSTELIFNPVEDVQCRRYALFVSATGTQTEKDNSHHDPRVHNLPVKVARLQLNPLPATSAV